MMGNQCLRLLRPNGWWGIIRGNDISSAHLALHIHIACPARKSKTWTDVQYRQHLRGKKAKKNAKKHRKRSNLQRQGLRILLAELEVYSVPYVFSSPHVYTPPLHHCPLVYSNDMSRQEDNDIEQLCKHAAKKKQIQICTFLISLKPPWCQHTL